MFLKKSSRCLLRILRRIREMGGSGRIGIPLVVIDRAVIVSIAK